jgi:ATP citrate (pro-S)-lyase
MVAGGGASVVYSDAIAAHGYAHELANYGEYSGAPTEGQTYEYAKTISECGPLYIITLCLTYLQST